MFGSSGSKVKISSGLWEKLELASQIRGASSPDELVEKILEIEVDKILQKAGKNAVSQQEVDDIANKLKGLGYLE